MGFTKLSDAKAAKFGGSFLLNFIGFRICCSMLCVAACVFCLVVQLSQNVFDFGRNWKPELSRIFKNGHALVADVEEQSRSSEHAPCLQYIDVQQVRHTDKNQNENLLAYA